MCRLIEADTVGAEDNTKVQVVNDRTGGVSNIEVFFETRDELFEEVVEVGQQKKVIGLENQEGPAVVVLDGEESMVGAANVSLFDEDGAEEFIPVATGVFGTLHRFEGLETKCFWIL